MYNENYNLPSEITAESKLMNRFPIKSIIILLVFLFVGTRLQDFVYETVKIPFIVFHMVVGLLFCIKSSKNRKKTTLQSILIMFMKDKFYYEPINEEKKLPDTQTKFDNYEKGVKYIEPDSDFAELLYL